MFVVSLASGGGTKADLRLLLIDNKIQPGKLNISIHLGIKTISVTEVSEYRRRVGPCRQDQWNYGEGIVPDDLFCRTDFNMSKNRN